MKREATHCYAVLVDDAEGTKAVKAMLVVASKVERVEAL